MFGYSIVKTKSLIETVDTSDCKTPGQKFAKVYGNDAVNEMLAAIRENKMLGTGVLALVMAGSFQHQQHYLYTRGMGVFGSIVAPLAIDLATLALVRTIATTGMAKVAKILALIGLAVPLSASGVINFVGSPNRFVGMVFLFLVSLIAIMEVVKAFTKPDFKSILAEEDKVQVATKIGRRDAKAQAAINAKANATRAKTAMMAMRLPELKAEAAKYGIDVTGLNKPKIQAAMAAAIDIDSLAPAGR